MFICLRVSMNIAIFTNNYFPNPYGVTQSIESFRKYFETQGHSVFIFAPRYKEYKDSNPRVFRFPSIDITYKFRFPLPMPYSRHITKELEKMNIDIIHAQHPVFLGIAAKKWAIKKNIPLVFTWHTLYDHYVHFVPFVPQKVAIRWIIKKATTYANACDHIIVPTQSIIPILRSWGVTNKNISAIPTGVEEKTYQNANGAIIREMYAMKEDDIVLFLNARLTKEKNVEFLFRSIVPILKKNRKVKLLVVSGGDLEAKLKKFMEKNQVSLQTIFAGVVQKEKIKHYYAAGDIFVYASKSETQGMIISEAMYMGLPVVAVRATGVSDLVKNNMSGILVAEDQNEFTTAVEKLIANDILRVQFSIAAKKIAQREYVSAVSGEKMMKVYEQAIERKKNKELVTSNR